MDPTLDIVEYKALLSWKNSIKHFIDLLILKYIIVELGMYRKGIVEKNC